MIERIKEFFKSLPVIGTPFNAGELTNEEEYVDELALKSFAGRGPKNKMAEIDITNREIRIVDTDWLRDDFLAHELAHWERFKREKVLNRISGAFGTILTWIVTFFVGNYIINVLFTHPAYTLLNYGLVAFLVFAIACKMIEEEKADAMKEEMKKKYDLERVQHGEDS